MKSKVPVPPRIYKGHCLLTSDATGWRLTQLRVHLARLVEMEYLLVHRGSRGLAFVYELLWQGEGVNGHRFVLGLLDTTTIHNLAGSEINLAGPKRDDDGQVAAGWRNGTSAAAKEDSSSFDLEEPRNAHQVPEKTPPSYSSSGRGAVALSAAAQGE